MELHAVLDAEKVSPFYMWLPLKRNINHERMRITLIVCNSMYRYGEAAVEGGGETGSWWDGKLQIGRCIHRIIPSHQLSCLPPEYARAFE